MKIMRLSITHHLTVQMKDEVFCRVAKEAREVRDVPEVAEELELVTGYTAQACIDLHPDASDEEAVAAVLADLFSAEAANIYTNLTEGTTEGVRLAGAEYHLRNHAPETVPEGATPIHPDSI